MLAIPKDLLGCLSGKFQGAPWRILVTWEEPGVPTDIEPGLLHGSVGLIQGVYPRDAFWSSNEIIGFFGNHAWEFLQ